MPVALVTGGTRGIGAAVARRLKQEGHTVIASYAANDEAARVFFQETGIDIIKWDVSQFSLCLEQVGCLARKYESLDILVHNAAITRDASLAKMTPEMWHQVIDTNLSSAFYLCQAVLPYMKDKAWGRVILMSSINALKGQRGQTNYAAAKAGLLGFTKSLAQEVAKYGITANVVAPGYTDTDMVRAVSPDILDKIVAQIPAGRLGAPEDIAHMVAFLAEKASGYMTGQTLHVNGGHWMS